MKLLVIVNGRNCEEYVKSCLESLRRQSFQDFEVVVMDDKSDDETCDKIIYFIDHYGLNSKYTVLKSLVQQGTANCRIQAELDAQVLGIEYDVVVWVDMDDYLLPEALQRIAKEYQDPQCWLTYGNMINISNGVHSVFKPGQLEPDENPRFSPWKYVHLRTHRKGLISHITQEDICSKEFEAYPDINLLYTMLELCGPKHIRPIYAALYMYRDVHPNTCINKYSFTQRQKEKLLSQNKCKRTPLKSL